MFVSFDQGVFPDITRMENQKYEDVVKELGLENAVHLPSEQYRYAIKQCPITLKHLSGSMMWNPPSKGGPNANHQRQVSENNVNTTKILVLMKRYFVYTGQAMPNADVK